MSDDPLRAEREDRPFRPAAANASDARPAWMGFLGGAIVLVLAIVIAVAVWHFAGDRISDLTPGELTEMETLLDRLGFPPGPVDGVVDEASRGAIRDFQVTAGLDVNGVPNLALLDELRAAQAELGGN
ncbi:MAG: peptidoglycan-binding domain-containing protein [Dongiaceae bacterium]